MKKVLSIVLVLLLGTVVLAGCAQQEKPVKSEKLRVVTTIFPPYDFTRAIAGDKADITMLLPPGSETHSFEPTPQDIIKIKNCDVFIYVGGESDEWVKDVLASMDTSEMKIITLMDCVETVEEEIVEGMQDEEEAHDAADNEAEEPEYDEHVWTSPRNAKLIVQKISDALCQIDSANAEAYEQNTAAYLGKLDELDSKFQAVVDGAARKTLVFGDRFPFRYFADAYGLTYFAAFPGCSTETDASASTVKFLIDKMNAENIPVVFHIELSNEKMANTISEATGAKVLLFHACHNISKADFEAGKTYLDLMTANVSALKEALQ
ncbi:zinc ABC transporter substrate-binding protein [Aminipila butyrica]|uniref:Zinc ABC transporter substrate-binding protein n=1 Tax=Aminipila butyrica TaxID=433296 RepID=A0A858BUQ4_9FIRM|nr:metal ABC transporter substrate-binding protein [Aminipila butyrica]QIB68805.1 zinc ABC transporter substrate-binding protein [Aminipila butyrica]